jgi:hypothetical protein
MKDLKITIDQLKNYLGTGLKVYIDQDSIDQERLTGIFDEAEEVQTNVELAPFEDVRPICYRLSDWDKYIPELGFIPYEKVGFRPNLRDYKWEEINVFDLPFNRVKTFFDWHFWPFGDEYFDHGLVIDKLNP